MDQKKPDQTVYCPTCTQPIRSERAAGFILPAQCGCCDSCGVTLSAGVCVNPSCARNPNYCATCAAPTGGLPCSRCPSQKE